MPYLHWGGVVPTISETLKQIIIEETQKRNAAISGAAFKQVLQQRSDIELPEGKFGDFLQQHSDVITIIKRNGSDILLIPKGEVHLLEKSLSNLTYATKKVRKDFYQAFTVIAPDKKCWYDIKNDSIKWLARDETVPHHFVSIPDRTEEMEISIRRDFVDNLPDSEAKYDLNKCFTKSWALSIFGQQIRRAGLADKWFDYRINNVVESINTWANNANIPIHESWFSGVLIGGHADSILAEEKLPEASVNSLVLDKLKTLDQADLSRITVPLDIVIKLLSK